LSSRLFHRTFENSTDDDSELKREERRDGVSYLNILLGTVSFEEIVVGEGLEASGLADSQTPALTRIIMNKIMTVL
jgi:hypothetical protein